jgi:hypothetical protein
VSSEAGEELDVYLSDEHVGGWHRPVIDRILRLMQERARQLEG